MTMQALIVVLLASGAFAAPFQVRSYGECSKKTLRFPLGKELTYNYVGETVSSVNGSSTAHSALKIKARCTIKTVGACQHVLKIDSVELWEGQSKNLPIKYHLNKETANFARELEAHELVFRSRNGAIVEVLSVYDEKPQTLNIKKGILSALQAQFVRDHSLVNETDISGKCPVHYRIHSKHLNGLVKVLSKTRNLKECSDRSKTSLGIHVHQYNEKSLNLLSSTSNCRYIVTAKRRVQKVVCQEKHMFRPFSSGAPAGAVTTTKQVLELQGVEKKPIQYGFNVVKAYPRSSPLTFEHVKPQPTSLESNKVIEIIKQLGRQSIDETKPESARTFSHLIFHLRKLDSNAVEKVWRRIFDCDEFEACTPQEKDKFQMYLLDALPHCGTPGCALVMSRAIERKLVSGERGNMFLTGLALVSLPTKEMISHILNLCQIKSSRTCMLTLGTLIHKYCEDGKCERNIPTIVMAETWLLGLLGKRCDFDNLERAEQIIMALKAIGNAGRPSSEQGKLILMKCANNQNLPTNMTIAAIKAFRRMPCSSSSTEQLFSIYDNHDVDVEIRIEGYLALLKCPSAEVFSRIAKIQQKEVNNQVGSFVWSHITNAMESTEPLHGRPLADMIRKALGGQIIREFNLNRLRFSRAWEASYYSDILRTGGSLQSHVIYHPNSYLPRSTHVNLTVDVLGASINVLEAAARFEGFEILIEQFFGRDGYYPDERIMGIFKNLKPHEQRGDEEKPIRGKRNADDLKMNKVETHLKELHEKMDNRKHAPSGAISVNLFGNEMRLASFDDINWLQSEADNINMVDFLIKLARGGSKTFTKSMMFLDAETTIPTILGLPLKLGAKGTTVVSVFMKGKFDIRNMFWGPMAFDVRGFLKPSAVVEVIGSMGVDAVFAETGILLNTSLYTSTDVRGNATYKQGQVLKFEVGAPSKPVQIFNVSSSLFATLNEEEIQIRGTQRRFEPAPCVNFTRVLGLAVCGRMSLPVAFRDIQAPFFPLSGPASFSLSVIPTDPKLRMYQIVAQRLPTEDESNFDIIARISTPNATWEREFEANASLWLKDQQKSFSISTGALGYKFGNLSGSYHNYTNAINLTFETRDVIYGNHIALNAQYFNKTNPATKERRIGTSWFAMYKNYTITQLTEIYNKSRTYGFVSNMTYWPGRYFYANGEVNMAAKRVSFLGNHTCTKTSVRFIGQLNKDYNDFLFNFSTGYKNMSFEVGGMVDKVKKEAIMKTFTLPFKQSFTLRSSYIAKENEKGIHFKASHDNKNRVFAWYTGFLNQTDEKSIKANASILGKPFESVLTFFNYTSEKGIKFNGSAVGKSINSAVSYLVKDGLKSIKMNASGFQKKAKAVWSYDNRNAEKRSVTFDATILKKSFNAEWAFINLTNVKSLAFNASGLNRNVAAAWSFLNLTSDKIVKFNASALNKTIEAFWSYSTVSAERSLKFNASALNRTIQSALTFLNLPREKSLKLNATVLNNTIQSAITFLNLPQEKSLKLNASALNRTIQSALTFLNLPQEKSLKLNAAVLNKTIESALTFLNLPQEKSLKLNATVLNKTIESALTFLNLPQEKSLKLNATVLSKAMEVVAVFFNLSSEKAIQLRAKGFNKSAYTFLSYSYLPDTKALKMNATVLNKTAEAAWTFLNTKQEKILNFSANVLNKRAEAIWTYFNQDSEKGLRFNAQLMKKKIEGVWSYFNTPSEKGLKFNTTILRRTANASLAYFKLADGIGVRFNASTLNRSIGLMSKMIKQGDDKKIVMSGSYQNYSMGLVAALKNLTTFKSVCVHSEFSSRPYGQICAVFSNSSIDKSISFNVSMLSRTAEVKAQRLEQPQLCSLLLTAKYNKTIYLESYLSRLSTDNLKTLRLNMTIANRSIDARWYMERSPEKSERVLGFNFTVLNRTMGLKSVFINTQKVKEASVQLLWNNTYVASSLLVFYNLTHEKILKLRNHIGRYVEVVQGEYRLREGAREFEVLYKLRNASKNMLYSSSLLSYKSQNSRKRELSFVQSFTVFSRSFAYGWDLVHENKSYESRMDHQLKAALMYSKGKKVSLTGKISNDTRSLSIGVDVEYLPKKFVKHSIVWYKERRMIETRVELLPRIPITNTLEWNTNDGFFVRLDTSAFNRNTESFFRYLKDRESYDGKIGLLPTKSVTFSGQFSRRNGLLVTSKVKAFEKEWSHKLEVDKEQRKFFISVELIPKKPISFGASWDLVKGLKIDSRLSALKKAFNWNTLCDNLTKSWNSQLTILKEKVIFLESFDVNTKTLNVSVKIRNRRIGFVGRFDIKAYVVSAYLTCNQWMTGWSLKLDRQNRNIIFNATLTSKISAQIVAEMPNNKEIQVTLQRKLGVNIVNESRILYRLSSEASRVFLTWNTTTVNYVVSKVQSLKPVLVNATMKLYNLSLIGAKNLTNKIDILMKDVKDKLKPHVLKYYNIVKSYDYKGAYKNISNIARNITIKALNFSSQAYNISLKTLTEIVKDLPKIVRNATELIKNVQFKLLKIRADLMAKVPQITAEVVKHLSNISRDLKSWGNNVSAMVGDIKIRNVKISTMVKRVVKTITELQKELKKNITIQIKKLVEKVRRMEIRKKNIGELVDKYMAKVRRFTCDFKLDCTWNNISKIALNISRHVRKMKILNKTVEQHLIPLKEKASNLSIQIKTLSLKLVKITPKMMRNATIQAIHLVRNISREITTFTQVMTIKLSHGFLIASFKVHKYAKPLTSLILKISNSVYNRAKPQILAYLENTKPMVAYVKKVYEDAVLFNKPMIKPLGPYAQQLMNQILKITIKKIPIGVALDKSVKITVDEAVRIFKELNHTISSNVTTIVNFLKDLSKKTPEEIVDITIVKVLKLVNYSKHFVNKSIEYTFNSSKKALTAYKESMVALEKNIKKLLNSRPEDLVELSIQKIQAYIKNATTFVKNMTKEVQTIAKQIQDLDFSTPSKKLWKEIDLVNKFKSLALGEKWNKTVEKYIQHFNSINLKERALAIKGRADAHALRILRELKAIAKLGERAFNLTMNLLRMQVTREDFVKELISIFEGSKMVATKHFHIAKNFTFVMYNLHNKYWDASVLTATTYKTLSLNKIKEWYRIVRNYLVKLSKEHENEAKETYEFYKAIALDIYQIAKDEAGDLKLKMDKKLVELKKKLLVKLEAIIKKLRKYENMTFEEMGIKIYSVSKTYGIALYKNYSIKVITLYNKTRNMTLRAYNLTKVMAVKYYDLSRVHAVRILNITKNLTVTYYRISRNMTIKSFHLSRNMTMQLFNKTLNITLRGINYLNTTVRLKLIIYYRKGKVIAIKSYNRSQELAKKAVNDLKQWYADNKEKTVEELYNEAYGVVNKKVNAAVEKVKARVEKVKAKLQTQLAIANKTLRNITLEVISVYNQTKNVSIIAGKQLIVIFSPYVKIAQNKSMVLFLQMKNISISLMKKAQNLTLHHIQKAKNLTILNFNKAKNFTIALYRNITNRKDFKEFMAKHQIKERYAKLIAKAKNFTIALYRNITNRKDFKEFMAKHQIKERYAKLIAKINATIEKVKSFIKETRPRLEANYRETIFYLNVTLPDMIKQKKQEIMADPKSYMKAIYDNATSKFKELIKDTPVEEIIMHEIWSIYLEEMKQHEIVEIGGELVEYGKISANLTLKKLKEKVKLMKIKVEELKLKAKKLAAKAKKMVDDTKLALKKGFSDFKQIKLKEIVEHRYVFKAIELAKNTTLKVQNITLQAKNITLKWVAIGKVFYKNMTKKAQNYTLIVKKFALELKKNYTVVFEKVKIIAKNYTIIARNVSIKVWKIASNWTMVKFNTTRLWLNKTAEMGIKMYKVKVLPYYKNKVLPYYWKAVPMYLKYKKFVIDFSRNMTEFAYNYTIKSKAYNFTVKSFNLTVELLRNASKMTPRQTAIKIKQAYTIAYNFTVKSSNKLMNVSIEAYKQGLKKLNVSRVFVVNFINKTIKLASDAIKPVIPFLNFTKHELIETAIFLNKYYGIEKYIRLNVDYHYRKFREHSEKFHRELHQQYKMLKNHSEGFMLTLPGLMKDSAYGTLDLVNKTIRYVHYSIRSVNATMLKFRNAIPKYIQIREGVIAIVIPHPKPVTGDIVSICNDACNKVKMLPETAKNMTRRALNATKIYGLKALNKAKQWREAALKTYREAQNVTKTLIDMAKNHPMTKKYLNSTIYVLNITSNYIRDLNIRYRPLAKKYVNATICFLNATRRYIRGLNFTKIANLTKIASLTKFYAPKAFNMTKEMVLTGLNTTRMYTMKVANVAWNISVDIYNSTCPMHALMKVRNYTLKAYNEMMKHYRMVAKKSMIKYYEMRQAAVRHKLAIEQKARILVKKLYRMTMTNTMAKECLNSTIHFFNITRDFVGKLNVTKIAKMAKMYTPKAFNMTKEMVLTGLNTTRMYTMKVANVAWNISVDIYNSTCPMHALMKVRNYTLKAYNEMMKHYRMVAKKSMIKYYEMRQAAARHKLAIEQKARILVKKLYRMTMNNTMAKECLNTTIHFFNITRDFVGKLNVTKIAKMAKMYAPKAFNMTKEMVLTGLNTTRMYTMKVANVAWNISVDIYNSTCPMHALMKVRNYTLKAYNEMMKHYLMVAKKSMIKYYEMRQAAVRHKLAIEQKARILVKKLYRMTMNNTMAKECLNTTIHFFNITRDFVGKLNVTKIAKMAKMYAPKAFNMTKEMVLTGLNTTRMYTMKVANVAWNISVDIYNSTCPMHALKKVRNYTLKAYNEMMKHYRMVAKKSMIKYYEMRQAAARHKLAIEQKARILVKKLYRMTMNNTMAQEYLNTTIHFFNITRDFVGKVNATKIVKMAKMYAPKVFDMTRDMCKVGFSAARNFTIEVANLAWNISADIYNSTCLKEALWKAHNHSLKAYNETVKLYKILYKETMMKYRQLNKTIRAFYKNILEHNLTKEYLGHARKYYRHSMKIISSRARHFHHLRKYWHRRLAHKLNHLKNKLSPSQWIPPFNSTAMIFGNPHVYTFDGKYFRFPGYNNKRCSYILARDVRDNKFTLMSQETALLLITDDANVEIHSDGRVESMIKINTEGEKVQDGYNSELPVQSANTTVAREGPYIILRHTLGLEILCDVDHYLCTFNIARWYHGRLAGLLGTNNNEQHDEMFMPNGKLTKDVIEFVNSWEITKDEKCYIAKELKRKQCSTKYSSRCKEIFSDPKSPFAGFFDIVDPRPFKRACENDFYECDTKTPKDMKHCNTTAAYIELLKMKGYWIDYLPECGRCGNHEMGSKWFQSASKAIDMILIVPETQEMQSFARQIPRHISELYRSLEGYSVRFGLVSFGGKGVHQQPHVVTMNGKYLGSAEEVKSSIEHLKFSDTMDNETDGFEAIAKAAHYPFRGASTKILVLFTTSERFANPNAPCIRRMTKKLQMRDITLNIIGKYQKFRGEKMGQDYLGRMIYRKLEGPSIRGVPLPRGEYVQLMQNTKGSLFGISFFASDNREQVYRPFKSSYMKVLREQIKRDQNMCKQCFCARGRVGEGRTICKINEHHKC